MTDYEKLVKAKESGHRYVVTDDADRIVRTGNARNTLVRFAASGNWRIEKMEDYERRMSWKRWEPPIDNEVK